MACLQQQTLHTIANIAQPSPMLMLGPRLGLELDLDLELELALQPELELRKIPLLMRTP